MLTIMIALLYFFQNEQYPWTVVPAKRKTPKVLFLDNDSQNATKQQSSIYYG